jgi:tetratricopeptide (TPR) repeat protein
MISSPDKGLSRPFVSTFQRFNVLTLTVSLLLAGLTILCYWPVTTHKFICLDDQHYLFESPYVKSGLTWQGIVWAFRTGYFSNWHPLTWISFMLDSQLFGLNPRGFLLTNLLLHAANTLLLFLSLKTMTGKLWPSALIAGLFAWHPLHVESVAWVSERKDVLSTLFFLLTLLAYTRYATLSNQTNSGSQEASPRPLRYHFLALLFFVLGLMSKPMVVTLPFVLLLMDYWPFRRFELFDIQSLRANLPSLLREKLVFFVLAFGASVITFLVQKAGGAVSSIEGFSISRRLANALMAYGSYVSKTLWPVKLSAVYPMPLELSYGPVVVAAVLLLWFSVLLFKAAKSYPFLIVGWLWFLGTLLPVIGVVQVGAQAMADRYTYIPTIGLFILLAWGLEAVSRSRVSARILLSAASVAALAGCLVCTRVELGFWRDSETLFRRAVQVVPNNYLGYDNLGKALEDSGRTDEAISCWKEAVKLVPGHAEAQYNLGTILLEQGQAQEAVSHLQAAVKAAPGDVNSRVNLGNAYLKLERLPEATVQYAEAATLKPEAAIYRRVLGSVLLRQSRWSDAETVLTSARDLDPANAEVNRNLGVALINQGRGVEAVNFFKEAVRLQPDDSEMRFNLGLALLDQNQPVQAEEQLAECVRLKPQETKGHYRLAVALARQHKAKEAIAQYREALRLTPEFPDALNELARLLACSPESELRDGTEAVKLAEKACAMTNSQQPDMLTTLAAAYAEAGRFPDAIATAEKARSLAASNGQNAAAAKAGKLLELCQSGRPLRE